jgi:hypothetical protein
MMALGFFSRLRARPMDMFAPTDARPTAIMNDPTIAHPKLAHLLAYWQRQRGERAMPARADIEPADLKALLANIFMVDVEDAPFRLRYRLVGSALVDVLGHDIKGKYLDEMPLLFRTFAAGAYEEVLKVRGPCYKEVNGIAAYFRIAYKRLLLPLSSDGQNINIILGAIYRD